MSEFGFPQISNGDLRRSDVPDPDGEFLGIEEFALTFDGYERWGSFEECAQKSREAQREWVARGHAPADLDLLRTALFFAQRAYRHVMQPMTIDGEHYPSEEVVLDGQRWPRELTRAIQELAPDS